MWASLSCERRGRVLGQFDLFAIFFKSISMGSDGLLRFV